MQTIDEKAVKARSEMLIGRPVAQVFEAFVGPEITRNFWFSKGSGRLEPGARLRWDWDIYGVGTDVEVKALEPNRRILIEWDGYAEDTRENVAWDFSPRDEDRTMDTITSSGFGGTGDEIVWSTAGSPIDSPLAMTTQRPNVVYIDCLDLGDWLGCYGRPYLRTPQLDRLAAQGMVLDRYFAAAPICMPSRAATFTGCMPHQSGVH